LPPQPPVDFTKYTLIAGFARIEGVIGGDISGFAEAVIVQRDIMVSPGQTARVINITPYEDGTDIESINTLTVGVFNADGTQNSQQTYDRTLVGSTQTAWVYRWMTQSLSGGYA
jgi:hypothetical protein